MAFVWSGLADRLGSLSSLSDAERTALAGLEADVRLVPRGAVLQREGGNAAGPWVLRGGWAASALALSDGGRQIVQLHLPGDLIGLDALVATRAGETLTALTEAAVAPVDRMGLGEAIGRHPRLGALLLVQSQIERQRIGGRMAAIGRTDARTRLASLLVDLADRQRAAGLAEPGRLKLPMIQEEIGDTLGLTAVHVNRMMRVLADERLITRPSGGQLMLLDEVRLRHFAGLPPPRASAPLDWLPASQAG